LDYHQHFVKICSFGIYFTEHFSTIGEVSPVAWQYINMFGRFEFNQSNVNNWHWCFGRLICRSGILEYGSKREARSAISADFTISGDGQ
jgi:hypothetical protein